MELKGPLKSVFKKDYLTRSKALQTIIEIALNSDDIGGFWDTISPSFAFLFLSMIIDPSYIIRTKIFELLKMMISYEEGRFVRNNITLWKEIFPYWLISFYEPEKSVRETSRAAFEICASFLNAEETESNSEPVAVYAFPSVKSIKLIGKLVGICEQPLIKIFSSIIDELKTLISKKLYSIGDSRLEWNLCSLLDIASLFQEQYSSFTNICDLFTVFFEKSSISYITSSRSSNLISHRFYSFVYRCMNIGSSNNNDIDYVKYEFLISVCQGILFSERDGSSESLSVLKIWSSIKDTDPKKSTTSSAIIYKWLTSKNSNIVSHYILPVLPSLFLSYCNDINWWFILASAIGTLSISSEVQQRNVAICLAECQYSLLMLTRKSFFSEGEIESKIIFPFLSNLLSSKAICPGSIFMSSFLDSIFKYVSHYNKKLFYTLWSNIVEIVTTDGFIIENLDSGWVRSFMKYSLSKFNVNLLDPSEEIQFLKDIYLLYIFKKGSNLGCKLLEHEFYGRVTNVFYIIENLIFRHVDSIEILLQLEHQASLAGSANSFFKQVLFGNTMILFLPLH